MSDDTTVQFSTDGEMFTPPMSIDDFEKTAKAAVEAFSVQLSFDVKPHIPGASRINGGLMGATLKISGQLPVHKDLQPGDQLRVVVTDADGQLVAESPLTVEAVHFTPIKDRGETIGIERVHKGAVDR